MKQQPSPISGLVLHACFMLVCYTAVFSVVTQCSEERCVTFSSRQWGGALHDNTKNGCVADQLYVGLDHLPLHSRRQLVLWFFYTCILKISPFALKILATMFMRKNVKNRNACFVGQPTKAALQFLRSKPLTYNMAFLLCSLLVSLKQSQKKRYLPR